MGSDKATKYILQLDMFDRLYFLTLYRTSLQDIQFKIMKISIFFVLVVVAVLFVAGKHNVLNTKPNLDRINSSVRTSHRTDHILL
jgi:hypothetical protein